MTPPSLVRTHLAPVAWVGLCATGLVVASLAELGGPAGIHTLWPCILLVSSATCFVYLFDRVLGTSPEDEAMLETWSQPEVYLVGCWFGICVFGAGCGLMALWSWEAWWVLLPMALLTFGYTVPLLPGERRLKDLPGVKIFLIVAVWTTATCVMPVWWVTGAMPPLAVVAMRAAFILAIAIPFDLRDKDRDARHGLRTLPHVLGDRGSVALGLALLCVVVGLGWWSAAVPRGIAAAITMVTAFNAMIVAGWSPKRGRLYYVFWCEGTMGFYAITLALANA